MFYVLTQIDDKPLPHEVVIRDTAYRITRGGLLLEPPGAVDMPLRDGRSIMKFFGVWPTGEEGFVAATMEPYRYVNTTQIEISRREAAGGARFSGIADQGGTHLTASEGRFLALGTTLTFVAAPDEPIGTDWDGEFYSGPAPVEIVTESMGDDPAALEHVRQWIKTHEPERRAAARARLERAWRAPPR